MTNQAYESSGGAAPSRRAGRRFETQSDAAGHIRDVKATSGGLVRATLGAITAAVAILVVFWLPAEYGLDPTGLGRVMGLTQMGEIKQQLYAEAVDEDAVLVAQAAADRVSADPALLARLAALESQVAGIAAALGAAPPRTSDAEALRPPAATAARAVPAPEQSAPAPEQAVPAPEQAAPAWRDEVSYTLVPTQGIEIKLVMTEGARAVFEWTANGAVLNHDTHGDGGGQSVTYEQGRGVPGQSGELVAAFDGNHGWFWRNRTDAPVTFTLRTRGDYSRMIAP